MFKQRDTDLSVLWEFQHVSIMYEGGQEKCHYANSRGSVVELLACMC